MCVAEYIISGVHQRTKGYKGLTDQLLLRARTHTHTPRVAEYANSGLHPRIKGYEGLADDVLLRAYTRLLQNKPIQGCNQGLHGFGRPTASVSTRMCVAEVAENINSSLHLGSRVTRIWQINCCCTPGSTVTRVWPTNCSCEPCSTKCCCEHTHTHTHVVLQNTQKSRASRLWPTKGSKCYKGPRSGAAVFTCPGSICSIYSATHMCAPTAAGCRPQLTLD